MDSGARVLVVDADRANLAIVGAALESQGFAVTAVPEFEQAVRLLKEHHFKGLVTAHRLGSHNGLHLVLRARLERPDTVAVLTCTVADPLLQQEAASFGALCTVAPWENPALLCTALSAVAVEPL